MTLEQLREIDRSLSSLVEMGSEICSSASFFENPYHSAMVQLLERAKGSYKISSIEVTSTWHKVANQVSDKKHWEWRLEKEGFETLFIQLVCDGGVWYGMRYKSFTACYMSKNQKFPETGRVFMHTCNSFIQSSVHGLTDGRFLKESLFKAIKDIDAVMTCEIFFP